MLNVTLLFFLLLIPLSGFIAWAGDRIGHKSGKRRHSLFGLRPRHTAMVFTIGSGMLTALVSFGAFYLFSETFRIVVRDGAEMYDKNRQLKQENLLQSSEITQARAQMQSIRNEINGIIAQRESAQDARDKVVEELEAAKEEQKKAEASLKTAQDNYTKAQAGLTKAQNNLGQAQTNLTQVRGELAAKSTLVNQADAKRLQADAKRLQAEKDLASAQKEVTAAKTRVDAAHRVQKDALAQAKKARGDTGRAVAMNQTLYKQTNDLLAQLDKLKPQFEDLQQRSGDLRGQVATLEGEKTRTEQEIRLLRENASALRGGQITYQVGEEVDRLTIPAGHNIWRVKAILYSFLSSASKKAETRGAGRNATERSVVILPRTYSDATSTVADQNPPRNAKVYTEENAISDTAELIRRSNEDTVIVANAATNAVAGETVPLNFHVFRNRVVIKSDTKLGELSINGDGPRQEIADRLFTFLNRDIHRTLIENGIIPHLRGEDTTGQDTARVAEQFSLGGEEWLGLIDNVRNAGPKARVVVYPARDLRAADTPALRFDVKRPLLQAPAFLRDIK